MRVVRPGEVQGGIAQVFREALEERGYSHAEVARLLDAKGVHVSPSSVTKMMNGDRGISMEMAMRLCDVLGVRWQDLYMVSGGVANHLREALSSAVHLAQDGADRLGMGMAHAGRAQEELAQIMIEAGIPVDKSMAISAGASYTDEFVAIVEAGPLYQNAIQLDAEDRERFREALGLLFAASGNAAKATGYMWEAAKLLESSNMWVGGGDSGARAAGD